MKGVNKKVTEGVWMVGDGRLSHPKDACVYLVDGGEKSALVDAGAGERPEAILANIESTGKNPLDIEYLLITHCHIDHVGGINHIRRSTGAKVVCHKLCAEPLERGDNERTAAIWYGTQIEPVNVDITFDESSKKVKFGDTELVLIHTPGHSPGSISIYGDIEGQRILFGQDIHGPFSPVLGSNIEQWRESMEKLIDLKADILCEGHYGVVHGAQKVQKFIRSFIDEYF